MKGQVTACGRVTTMVRENMMKLLLDSKAKGNDSKRRKEEFEERLRGDDEDADEDMNTRIDDQLRYATQESLRSHREWENMQQFRRETRASENAYEHGGSSRVSVSVSGAERPEEISFSLRYTNIDLVRSQSMKQPRVGKGFLKTWRGCGRDIVRPGVTRFATQFLQFQAIVRQKEGLENMFNSEEFRKTKYGKENKGLGYEARKIVISRDFWSKANDILKVFEPIVKVLRLVGGDEKPTMGFIYEAIDRSKQAIQQNSRYHSKYNDIIEKRWKFMHSDLHSAETFNGTTNVIMKIKRNMDDQIKVLHQLTLFREKSETFGTPLAQKSWSKMDADDENVDDNSETNESGGGLSPPSSNSGDGGGNEVDNEGESEGGSGGGDDEGEDDELDPYHETPLNYRRHRNLTDMDHSDNLLIETRGNVSQSGRKGKRKQNVPLEYSSSSSIAHSFSDFRIGDSAQSSQQSYPPVYQYSYFNPYNQYPSDQAPQYYQQSTNYHNHYHQQSSDDFFGYVFGQGATQDDS
ncbi:hypothetical protein KIW84_070963 [Lathyrus oleraceus]|uniref:Uncharacterized protein n=1 Tax=Pisum sativum TaxID=3888 RepID=A0A9D4VI78_PEA|nr:hypothetical protein KIW84_070963 [Pisum sativum]